MTINVQTIDKTTTSDSFLSSPSIYWFAYLCYSLSYCCSFNHYLDTTSIDSRAHNKVFLALQFGPNLVVECFVSFNLVQAFPGTFYCFDACYLNYKTTQASPRDHNPGSFFADYRQGFLRHCKLFCETNPLTSQTTAIEQFLCVYKTSQHGVVRSGLQHNYDGQNNCFLYTTAYCSYKSSRIL